MRISIILFFLIGCIFQLQAQTDTTAYSETDTAHVDTPPQFPGGLGAFAQFMGSHLIMPPNSAAGTIYFEYIIEINGSLTNIRILKSAGTSNDQALIDALSQSPRWKPGLKNGKAVRVKKTANFQISIKEVEEVTTKKKKKR